MSRQVILPILTLILNWLQQCRNDLRVTLLGSIRELPSRKHSPFGTHIASRSASQPRKKVVNKPVWGKQYHTDKCLIADSNAKHGYTWSNRPRFTTLRSSHGTEYVRHSDVPMGAKFNNMLYATIDGTRSYSGEIYQDITIETVNYFGDSSE